MNLTLRYSSIAKSVSIFSLLLLVAITACKKDDEGVKPGKITLQFNPMVNGQELILDDQEFTNTAGNKYRVEKLKYYVSKLAFYHADGSVYQVPDGYFLLEETSLSKRREITIENVPVGNYIFFSFAIGVDSARNLSTEMVGELNPNNDMAWNWVSGYKFFLLEGKFTTSSTATEALVLHIGGNRSYRTVTLNTAINGFQVNPNHTTTAQLAADVNKVFNAIYTIDLNATNAVMQPGEVADKIADNYASGMFSVQKIQME